MIFVALGTYIPFERLIKRIDQIAPQIKEKIIIQTGDTKYKPKNCESFDWAPSLDPYMKKARLIICQSALSMVEAIREHKKPVITVPRQYKYKEHINDHQVEFAQYIEKKFGIKAIYNIKDLTPELIKSYNKFIAIDTKNLKMLQNNIKDYINSIKK